MTAKNTRQMVGKYSCKPAVLQCTERCKFGACKRNTCKNKLIANQPRQILSPQQQLANNIMEIRTTCTDTCIFNRDNF